ncbi:MAG: DUF72 domain-containing protein [bacterium]
MRVFVGTSGWFYDWNPQRSLDWFVGNSGLNAVELNASFYRFPFPNQVNSWAAKGRGLRWAVKVSRLVSHVHRLNEEGFGHWERFFALFARLDRLIDFYLFQLHPRLGAEFSGRVAEFIKRSGLSHRFALECRNKDWFKPRTIEWAKALGITLVSVDAPGFPREIYNTSGLVYLRMHGRTGWYQHHYTRAELKEVIKRIRAAKPEGVYVFFNNDQDMLDNARQMLKLFAE